MAESILYPGAGQPFSNYAEAKTFLNECGINLTAEQSALATIAQRMLAQTPKDSDLPLIMSMGDSPTSSEGLP